MDISLDFVALRQEVCENYLFAGLETEQLERVLGDLRTVRLHKGEPVFAQGDPARRFYLVRRGQIKLFRLSPEGNEKVLELIRPGQTFAEALLFMSGPVGYPVHAEAVEASELLSFDNARFRTLLRESVDTCFRLMAAMSRRLHSQINEIDQLTLHSATSRLVSYLLEELPEDVIASPQVRLTTSKTVIASRLSIQPETLSRILARLARKGHLEVRGANIVLHDIPALRALVELDQT